MIVPRVFTGSRDRAAWLRRVYVTARAIARRRWLLEDDESSVRELQWSLIALSAVCYLDMTARMGLDEYNNNPALLEPSGPFASQFELGAILTGNATTLAAFETLDAGVWAFFQSVQRNERAYSLLGTGYLAFARWYAPGLMYRPVEARSSFNLYLDRCDSIAGILLQPRPDAESEWEAWSGRVVVDDPNASGESTPAEDEPTAAPPRVVRPGFAYSATLGREVANGSCVQSRRDRLWYQARAGEWALCPGGTCPVVCVERYPLAAATVATGSSGSSGSSVGPFLLLGAGWALWWALGRK